MSTRKVEQLPSASFEELQAAHAARLTAASAKRDQIVRGAEDMIRSAHAVFAQEHATAESEHTAEVERRIVAVQRSLHTELRPLAAEFMREPARAPVIGIVAKWVHHRALARQTAGYELDERRVAFVMVDILTESNPAALGAFVETELDYTAAAGIGTAAWRLFQLLNSATDVAGVHDALLQLERAITHRATQPQDVHPDHQARFEILKFGGSPAAVAAQLAELDRLRRAASAAEWEAERDRVRAARRGEHVEGKTGAWWQRAREFVGDHPVFGPLLGVQSTPNAESIGGVR